MTANDGDDKECGDFEEKQKSKDIFDETSLGFAGMTADVDIFYPNNATKGTSAIFNRDCKGGDCATKMRVTVGSSMVDYSDPTIPNIEKW